LLKLKLELCTTDRIDLLGGTAGARRKICRVEEHSLMGFLSDHQLDGGHEFNISVNCHLILCFQRTRELVSFSGAMVHTLS